MATRSEELEEFKTRIPLEDYALSCGYVPDKKSHTKRHPALKNASGDKIIITRKSNGHWVYSSVHNDDRGTIIDFIQSREGGDIGEIRKKLRPWLDGSSTLSKSSKAKLLPGIEPIPKDLDKVRANYNAMKPINGRHSYLEDERKIPADILADPRFEDRIRIDYRQNAIFPHFNREGICGYEIKNKNFTSFSTGGEKGLFTNRTHPDDNILIIGETVIDILSYATLKRPEKARFLSIGGAPSPAQEDLLKSAIEKMSDGSKIVCIMDADDGGIVLTQKISAIFDAVRRSELIFIEDRPNTPGDDWNDVLRASMAKIDAISNTPVMS